MFFKATPGCREKEESHEEASGAFGRDDCTAQCRSFRLSAAAGQTRASAAPAAPAGPGPPLGSVYPGARPGQNKSASVWPGRNARCGYSRNPTSLHHCRQLPVEPERQFLRRHPERAFIPAPHQLIKFLTGTPRSPKIHQPESADGRVGCGRRRLPGNAGSFLQLMEVS